MSEGQEELEDFLQNELFSDQPKSVGEAVEQAEDAPIVVPDEPPEKVEAPPAEPEPPAEPQEPGEPEPEEEESLEDEGVVWAKKKYGEDTEKWARAAYEQERHISRLAQEKREADELASQWYDYAQQVEQQSQQANATMPLSAQEEQWVANSLANPIEFARQAAFNGKTQLFNGVIQTVAEENPTLAAQIMSQVQMELASYAQQQPEPQQEQSLESALKGSFGRLNIDLEAEGARMSQKIGELGEYHPYVQAIMGAEDGARDVAVQAVYDLSRTTPRQQQRNQNIAQENEMRRDAASVQTGGIQAPPPPPADSPLLQAMTNEWQRAGQWPEDE